VRIRLVSARVLHRCHAVEALEVTVEMALIGEPTAQRDVRCRRTIEQQATCALDSQTELVGVHVPGSHPLDPLALRSADTGQHRTGRGFHDPVDDRDCVRPAAVPSTRLAHDQLS